MELDRHATLYELIERWSDHFGYRSGSIDLDIVDLSGFATSGATLTAHPPLWGTKPGEERAVPLSETRRRLARLLRFVRTLRHDMHIGADPDQGQICISFVLKLRLAVVPIPIRSVGLAMVFATTETAEGLRIDRVDEWPAENPAAADALLREHYDWPAEARLRPAQRFGSVS